MMQKSFKAAAILLVGLLGLPVGQALSATTGLDFAGGCPEGSDTLAGSTCYDTGPNATTANVADILGVAEEYVTEVFSGFTTTAPGGDVYSGTWSVTDPSITHIAFKAAGHFVLFEVNDTGGDFDLDPDTWDLTLVSCPASICGVNRDYVNADFLNDGGNIASLSNVRAFSVVPVPAAVWLFGSGLIGLIGVARRKKS